MKPPRSIRVAAVQVASENGAVDENLARAEGLVARAVAGGAQLALCPEFLAAGYVYDVSIWKSAERRDGPTESWLRRVARAHGIYLGASYLEAEGDDFFNTFALAAPDGAIAGRVRKESLPAFEGWFFKSCDGPKTMRTELGTIAVGICHDGHTARFYERVAAESPDLILLPHSAPCIPLGRALARRYLAELGAYYARAFGAPAVVANKAATRSRSPIPGVRLVRLDFEFPGMSTIADADARVLAQLADDEAALVAEVTLDPARKRAPPALVPDGRRYWSRAPDAFPRALGLLFAWLERRGARAYARSRSRVRAARAHTG